MNHKRGPDLSTWPIPREGCPSRGCIISVKAELAVYAAGLIREFPDRPHIEILLNYIQELEEVKATYDKFIYSETNK